MMKSLWKLPPGLRKAADIMHEAEVSLHIGLERSLGESMIVKAALPCQPQNIEEFIVLLPPEKIY